MSQYWVILFVLMTLVGFSMIAFGYWTSFENHKRAVVIAVLGFVVGVTGALCAVGFSLNFSRTASCDKAVVIDGVRYIAEDCIDAR